MAKLQRNVKNGASEATANSQDVQSSIAQKAYELWEQSGRIDGRDLEHWLEAERLVTQGDARRR